MEAGGAAKTIATATVKKPNKINGCVPPNNKKDVIITKNQYQSTSCGVTLYGNGGEEMHREAVRMNDSTRRSAPTKATKTSNA
jgi:hypothetical protein